MSLDHKAMALRSGVAPAECPLTIDHSFGVAAAPTPLGDPEPSYGFPLHCPRCSEHGLPHAGRQPRLGHRPPRPDGAVAAGSARATISTASATRTATAMYCRPAFVYVTGNPVVGPGT